MSLAPADAAAPAALPASANGDVPSGALLSATFKCGYGLGQAVESIATVSLNTYLFFYLTNVCGLSGSLTGVALFAALTIDAVADPVIGSVSDNLRTRWGRRVPVMAISLIPLALSQGLLFSVPPLSGWVLFLYVCIILMAMRIAMSGFIVPYLGLGAELTCDYDDRSSIVAFRVIFGMLSMLVPLLLGFGLFLSGHHGLLHRAAYARFGWSSGAVLLVAGTLATLISLRGAPRLAGVRTVGEPLLRRLHGEVREVFRNPSFRRLFGGVLLFFIGQGLTNALALDANQYFWSLDVERIQIISISLIGGLALGLPIAFPLIGHIEKRTIVLAGIALFALAQGLPALLQLCGVLPVGMRVRLVVLVGAALVAGAAATLITISFQSAMADAVDEHEQMFNTRREGLYFASLSFATKAATGLGSMVAGFLLEAIRFPSSEIASGRAVNIGADILRNLALLYGPAAALITLASLLFFWRYRLNRTAHAEISTVLAQRHAAGIHPRIVG